MTVILNTHTHIFSFVPNLHRRRFHGLSAQLEQDGGLDNNAPINQDVVLANVSVSRVNWTAGWKMVKATLVLQLH